MVTGTDLVIYENNDFVILKKPCGIISEGKSGKSVSDIYGKELFCIHRLDKDVSGIMVYAKNSETAAIISKQIQSGNFKKQYLAVIHGKPEENKGIFKDLLYFDRKRNKSFVVNKKRNGVKEALLEYKILSMREELSLVKVHLLTGRTHQIRVQFASRGFPLYADRKYGGRDKGKIALFSYKISFLNSKTQNNLEYSLPPDPNIEPWNTFSDII